MILGDIIKRNARLYGDRPGLIFEDRRYSHRDFAKRVFKTANMLRDRGVKKQERVAIISRNTAEVLELFGAGDTAGFISLNINHRLHPREMLTITNDAEPTVLVFEPPFAEAAEAVKVGTPSIRQVFSVGEAIGKAEELGPAVDAASDAEPADPPGPDDIAYLFYTSGTTGRPKGVMNAHRGLLAAARSQSHENSAGDPVTALIVMPLFHVGGRIESFAFSVLGGTLVLHRQFDPVGVLATIERERITATHLAPIMVERLVDHPDREKFDTSSLKCVHYASAPMPVPLLKRAIDTFGLIFNQTYGMTECCGGTKLRYYDHKPGGSETEVKRLGSAGQPYIDTRLRIERPDGGEAALGEVGEVLIDSPATMVGYWNNPEATAEALRDGWYHTGDLGYLDEDGYLFIYDRMKDMIVSGGENIYSLEVEEALRTHPAVQDVAVIAVPDPDWGEAVKACVILKPGAAATEEALIEHCRTQIASYKKPKSVDFIDELPRLFNGKVNKKALRAPYWEREDRQVS